MLHSYTRLLTSALVSAGCLAIAPHAGAQQAEPPPGPLTLAQVLQIAEARSEAVAIARAGIARAEGEYTRARSGLFPQFSVSGGYERTLASEFDQVFDDGFLFPSEPDGGGDLRDLPFGREHIWRATLSFSQNLYSGGRNGAQIALADASRDATALNLTSTTAQLQFDVTRAYYDVLLSERLVAIASSTLDQAEETLRLAQASHQAGTQPEFEVLRARVSRDNQRPPLIQQRVNRELALLRLKQLLDLPPDYDLQLADALDSPALAPPAVFAERVAVVERVIDEAGPDAILLPEAGVALPDRTPVAEAEAAVRLNEATLRLARAQRWPSVTLQSSYGRVAYPSSALWGFDGSRANWTIGALVQMPLFTGGRIQGDEAVARAGLEESQARRQQVAELAALDTRAAWAELLAARATWESSIGTVEQAVRAYEIADVRYRAGVSTQLELTSVRLQREQAEVNRAMAARDLQVARARVALLPNLPVAGDLPVLVVPAPASDLPVAPTQPTVPLPGPGQQLVGLPAQGGVVQGVR